MIRENTIPPHKKILTTVKNEGTSPKNENLTVCHGEGKEVKARSSFPSINIPAEERKNMYECKQTFQEPELKSTANGVNFTSTSKRAGQNPRSIEAVFCSG